MADLTRANLRTEVRRLLNEPTANVFSDDEINDWIDIAARNISAIVGCIQTRVKYALSSAGQLMHDTSSTDFIKVDAVVFEDVSTGENDAGLQRITPEMLGNVTDGHSEGIPRFYCFHGDDVYVWPTASATQSADVINVMGPTMVADFGTTLPEYLQYPCVHFALACAYCKDGKHRKAALEMQRYMTIAMHFRRDIIDDFERVDGKESRKSPDRTITAEQR